RAIKSIDYIKKTVPDARLFVFTDSPEWVKENWREEIVLVEDKEAENALSDMYLMSQCKHNIIANSTFSWWGAWLNQNPDKVVIGPNKWINTMDEGNPVCEDWIRI
ncbi:MAG: alpha-1,2-fucosyltransferase, partial [Bacteroidaceae bacterium]|nr:alpha-1,2-fucosyltransferase [Bacteroidaceae bacterium]